MKFMYGLLILIPVAVVLWLLDVSATWIFVVSAGAIIPLSALLGKATEELAAHTGPQIGGLLNVTFGNAVELIITIAAIRQGLLELVRASISGGILGNVLLVLGGSLLVGGLRHGEQKFDAQFAGLSSTMMTLSVVALVIPGMFASGSHAIRGARVESLSMGLAVVLLVLYACYVWYTLQKRDSGRAPGVPRPEGTPEWSIALSLGALAATTVGTVVVSEILVEAVEAVVVDWGLTELFLGVVLVPIIGSAAEHWAAIQAAARNHMDLSLGIAIGSSLQLALFVAPVLVFVSAMVGHPLSLVFNVYELTALAGAVIVATFIAFDGRSNWVEGAQLVAVYAIVGMGFYYLP